MKKAPATANYTELPYNFGDIMTVDSFRSCVEYGGFIDYDGSGYAGKEGLIDTSIDIRPSKVHLIPLDAEFIQWYNR